MAVNPKPVASSQLRVKYSIVELCICWWDSKDLEITYDAQNEQ